MKRPSGRIFREYVLPVAVTLTTMFMGTSAWGLLSFVRWAWSIDSQIALVNARLVNLEMWRLEQNELRRRMLGYPYSDFFESIPSPPTKNEPLGSNLWWRLGEIKESP